MAVEPALAIYDPALLHSRSAKAGPARLSWLATIDVFRVFVDARTGEVLFFYMDQRSLLPRRVNDLEGRFCFSGVVLIDDAAGTRREPIPDDAQNAYVNSGHALDYFARTFGRSGIDDAGPVDLLPAYVRYGNTTMHSGAETRRSIVPSRGRSYSAMARLLRSTSWGMR